MQTVGIIWIAIYVVIGLLSVELVRFAGPKAIGANYRIEETYDDDSGKLNVSYRIIAPTICCELPVFALAVACDAISLPGPTLRFLPVVFYWLILGVTKHARHALLDRLAPFLGETVVSLLLSLAFDHFVIGGYLEGQGISVLDNSSIAFQFELALFGFATYWISSLFISVSYRKYQACFNSESDKSGFRYSNIDTSEAKLFLYEREYGGLLPRRFSNDVLLRALFFTIMAIEDGNRPEFIRTIERLAARFNLAKTTGIMQQSCDRPLSDVDSVRRAIPYIEKMWDRYLAEFARSVEGSGGKAFRIYSGYYTYDYGLLSQSLKCHFAPFYGDYCGTRVLDANSVFCEVLNFEERQRYCLLPDRVSAYGSVCAPQAKWLAGDYCFWSNHETIVSCLADGIGRKVKLVNNGNIREDALAIVGSELRRIGATVLSIKYVEGIAVELLCDGDVSAIEAAVGAEWVISD